MQTSITITTHNSAGGADITLSGVLSEYLSKSPKTGESFHLGIREISYENRENVLEETFYFHNTRTFLTFLGFIPTFITCQLANPYGDDDYFDYRPALMEQVREFLTECLHTKFPESEMSPFEKEHLRESLRINITFFNALLVHQDTDESHCGENGYYWCSEIQPISL